MESIPSKSQHQLGNRSEFTQTNNFYVFAFICQIQQNELRKCIKFGNMLYGSTIAEDINNCSETANNGL
ncbi:CLUMA_CG003893, isoform A [Clunio marinus]|uniref:CLUMA_CG003893, isoform A n=1 Tax=Clunio marinus TaxID=568069 RepID=A0A1J1HQC3_9DIPT|nr:CLUMA_CG003893, isoform A [Clunio marinus]